MLYSGETQISNVVFSDIRLFEISNIYILRYKDFKEYHPLLQGQQKRLVTTMADHLEFYTGLRGFHVYSNTINWRPDVGQKLTFKRKKARQSS